MPERLARRRIRLGSGFHKPKLACLGKAGASKVLDHSNSVGAAAAYGT